MVFGENTLTPPPFSKKGILLIFAPSHENIISHTEVRRKDQAVLTHWQWLLVPLPAGEANRTISTLLSPASLHMHFDFTSLAALSRPLNC